MLEYGSKERTDAENIFSIMCCIESLYGCYDDDYESRYDNDNYDEYDEYDGFITKIKVGFKQYYNGDMDHGENHCWSELCGCSVSDCGWNSDCDCDHVHNEDIAVKRLSLRKFVLDSGYVRYNGRLNNNQIDRMHEIAKQYILEHNVVEEVAHSEEDDPVLDEIESESDEFCNEDSSNTCKVPTIACRNYYDVLAC
jgi:hypothetical protein